MTTSKDIIEWTEEQKQEMRDKLLAWYDKEKDYYLGEKTKTLTGYGYQKLCSNKLKW